MHDGTPRYCYLLNSLARQTRRPPMLRRRPCLSRSKQVVVRPPRLEIFLKRGCLERLNDFDDMNKAWCPAAPAMAARHCVPNVIQMDAQPPADGSPVGCFADVDQASILCVKRIASRLRTAWCLPPAFMRMGVNCKLREGGRPLGRTILLHKPQHLPAVSRIHKRIRHSKRAPKLIFPPLRRMHRSNDRMLPRSGLIARRKSHSVH
jgi:hypothetical protein